MTNDIDFERLTGVRSAGELLLPEALRAYETSSCEQLADEVFPRSLEEREERMRQLGPPGRNWRIIEACAKVVKNNCFTA